MFQRVSPHALTALLAIAGCAAPGVASAGPPTNIDTAQPFYLASDLGTTVNPVFQGGVLKTDQAGATYGFNFTLDGSGSNTIDQAGNASTFSGVFSDAVVGTPGGLIIANSATGGGVTFTGVNTYTGATTIDSGASLLLADGGAIAASSGVANSGTFDISGTTSGAAITTLSGGGAVTLGARTLTLTNASGVFGGDIAGSGGLTLAGGAETLSGANDYSGATTVSAGTLSLTGGIAGSSSLDLTGATAVFDASNAGSNTQIGGLSGVAGSQVRLGAKGLTVNQASATTFAGVISGSGASAFIKTGDGALTLSGVNTYTNATTISGGTLALSGLGSIAQSSGVADNGTFDISATTSGASITTLSGSGAVALGGQTLTLTSAADTFGGVISGATGGLTIAGGSETLTGVNTYTGATSIHAGATLTLSGGGGIAASSGVADNGTFDISSATTGASIASLSGAGVVALGSRTLTLTQASGAFSGAISGAGGLVLAGGSETLSGTNGYAGGTTVTGGTLTLTGAGTLGASSGTLTVSGGALDLGGTTQTTGALTLNGGTIEDRSGGGALDASAFNVQSGAISAVLGGSGGLTQSGSGETILSGANTYTGGTTVLGGTLALTGLGALGASGGTLTISGGVLDLGGTTQTTGAVTLNGGTIEDSVGGGALKASAFDVQSGEISAALGGASTLTKTGAGVLTLTGVNTYTGATTISGGPLTLSGSGAIAQSSGVADNGAFDISATTAGASITTLSGNGTVAVGGQTLTLTNAAGAFNGVIGGSGGLTIAGGQQTLGGVNTYTGATRIGAGATLALAGNGGIAPSSGVADDGVFDISATTAGAAITSLSGAGSVSLGGQTLTLTNASGGFSGAIGGAGGLAVTGGAETLTGVSVYGGGTTVHSANLAINGDAALGGPAGGLALNNATLTALNDLSSARVIALTGMDTINTSGHEVQLSGAIGGPGALIAAGGGQLGLGGVNTYGGGSAVTGGTTLTVGSDTALGAAGSAVALDNGTLAAMGALTTARPILIAAGGGTISTNGFTVILSGPITLGGVLTASGAGKIDFTGAAQGAGALSINDGLFSDNGQITAQSVTVSAGATLRGVGAITAPTTVSGTLAPGNSPGTLTFNAPVTLTASATTAFDIDGVGTGTGSGNFSRVIVTGAGGVFTAGGVLAPRLRGITGSAGNTFTPQIGQLFQVVSAAGGIAPASSFSGLIQPAGLAAGTRFDALYGPTTLSLVVTPADYANLGAAGIAETPAEKAVGAMLDADRPAAGVHPSASQAAIYDPLYSLSAAQIPAALNEMSPTIYADALMAARQSWYAGAGAVSDQLTDRRGMPGSGAVTAGLQGVTSWGDIVGQVTDIGPSGARYHSSVGDVVVGVDKTFGNGSLIGFSVGGGNVQTGAAAGGANGDLIQAAVYGSASRGPAFVQWQADYLHIDQDVTRVLGFAGASLKGHDTLQGAGGQVGAGLDLAVMTWLVEPSAGVSAVGLTSTAAHESAGAALAESVNGQNINSLQSNVEVRIARMVNLTPQTPLQVHALIGWDHELDDTSALARASLAGLGGGGFTTTSVPVGRDAIKLGAGFEAQLTTKITVYGTYSAAFANQSSDQNLSIGARVRW